MKFYNRENELRYLNSLNNKNLNNKYNLIIITGRRRVGKTELIKRINKLDFYFYITEENSKSLLKSFENQIKEYYNDEFLSLDTWDSFLKYLINKSKKKTLTICFDEFQNFKKVDESFFSILQKYIDLIDFEKIPINIICIGSYVNMIKNIFNNSNSSLYGRKTAEILLKPLEFKYIYSYLKKENHLDNNEEIIKIYSLFGGIPRYYKLISNIENISFDKILNQVIFSNISPLSQEIQELFFENIIKSKKEYMSILKAISLGYNTNKLISDFTKIEKTSLPSYLNELINVYEIVEKKIPFGDNEFKSKKGRYFIIDNFLNFWFRFIQRYKSYYELEQYGYIKEKIKKEYDDFIGNKIFEQLSKIYLNKKYLNYLIGSYWSGNIEIDIMGKDNDDNLIIGECKWTNKKISLKLYNEIMEKLNKLKIKDNKCKIYLFSKSGFEKNLIKKRKELGLELIDLNEIIKELIR